MARIEECHLREIIAIPDGRTAAPFIAAANSLTDWVANCAGSKLTAAQLNSIELFLAAHFYQSEELQKLSEKAGDASVTYQQTFGDHMRATMYGSRALDLDTSGCLAKHNAELEKGLKRTPQMVWLGKVPSNQTHVWNRD